MWQQDLQHYNPLKHSAMAISLPKPMTTFTWYSCFVCKGDVSPSPLNKPEGKSCSRASGLTLGRQVLVLFAQLGFHAWSGSKKDSTRLLWQPSTCNWLLAQMGHWGLFWVASRSQYSNAYAHLCLGGIGWCLGQCSCVNFFLPFPFPALFWWGQSKTLPGKQGSERVGVLV